MENMFVSENGKDLCISCEGETKYKHDTDIEYRENYIEGAGQLCDKCYDIIVGKLKDIQKKLEDEERLQ